MSMIDQNALVDMENVGTQKNHDSSGGVAPAATTTTTTTNPLPYVVSTNTAPDGTVTEVFSDGSTQTIPSTAGTTYAQNAQSATTTVDAWAQSVGLGSLSSWINSQIQTLAGQGMDAGSIATQIATTINTAPGFDAILPGYNQRIANGYTNTDPNTGAGIAGYMAYVQQVQAMAETAGMVPGTISATDARCPRCCRTLPGPTSARARKLRASACRETPRPNSTAAWLAASAGCAAGLTRQAAGATGWSNADH